ncbi:bifunctional 3-(3-hydroxy-phenyl)propionate/3-hydroxycinnamic acid hydroxylase [Bradyrhizobium sp. CCBAU 51765]|uniref:bifunctional 3-(3-hydroxy-phenyl)propionate/3-hydroxycinnamic acid hydroxylase MhpA n=1 Tax=Bradyrhizobium sp. CCBAU 51765 TaxID=1325102 RepID=UPI00188718B8|nr:bifunctional 3-(3-hydroxy-phenyl)propionate/3-hydroxycinnamic acid hydroxylase [Bradyrhizobium sp. CCBAU 51765]QOZ06524.1 3-(3-hydroxyphenyl)propionate hydroxylase [Bradyrhizobium sp. CCBAU 51765]
MAQIDFDVAVVGYGPTGLTAASLLGQLGHRVLVVERWPSLYGLPRLTHIDGETARLLNFACDIDEALRDSSPIESYIFYNGKGKRLIDVADIPTVPMGFPAHISIHQPDIEAAIDRKVRSLPNVTVQQGTELVGLRSSAGSVELSLKLGADVKTVRSRYVFGSDGARSFVRSALGIERDDSKFTERWLNIDGERKRPLPASFEEAKQYCDPARGHMFLPIGSNRQRFEFALLPHEDTAKMERPESAWRILKQYHGIGPEDIRIIRQTVYTFECRMAQSWRSGSVFLGGDAAHTMPPYLGQGACSGIRDAANFAWKLDLVLRGTAAPDILASYETERRPHVANIMRTAVMLGKVANTHSRAVALFRDLAFRFNLVPPPPPFPSFSDGVIQDDRCGERGKVVGSVPPQGRVEIGGRIARFDDHIGYGFSILAQRNPVAVLGPSRMAFLRSLGCRVLTLTSDAGSGVEQMVDADGIYSSYLAEKRAAAMLIRPDTNLFGFAGELKDVPELVDEFRRKLSWQAAAMAA